MSPTTITIIGSLNTDLVTRAPRAPSGGETLLGTSFETGSGGKGANQAVACARLSRTKQQASGSKKRKLGHADSQSATTKEEENGSSDVVVKMVGAVGDDEFGRPLVSGMEEDGIDMSGVTVSKEARTGVASIIVEEDTSENRILVTPGANFLLRPEHFKELAAPLPGLLVLQLEIPFETVVQILRSAKAAGVPVLMNPAPAVKLPEDVYDAITHLIVNRSEGALLSDIPEETIQDEVREEVTTRLNAKGVKNVVLTLGGEGAFFSQKSGFKGYAKAQSGIKVVDTTAAGDTFVGAYAVEVARSSPVTFDIESAVKKATKASAITVQREGAQKAIPWVDEIE